jgi:hypothetical protein
MRKFILAFVYSLAITGTAFADCASPTAYGSCCGGSWVEYSQPIGNSCWTLDAALTSTTLSCYWGPSGYDFRGFSQHATRSFTVADSGTTHWEISFRTDITDPSASWWTQLDARVSVVHNGTNTVYYVYYHNGTQGDVSCASPYYDFTATQGDTITIDFNGSIASTDSHVKVGDVHLFRLTP